MITAYADLRTHELSKDCMSFTFLQVSSRFNGEPLSWACQGRRWELPDLTSGPVTSLPSRGAPPGPSDVTELPQVHGRRCFQGHKSCCKCAVGPAEAGAATCSGRSLGGLAVHARCCSSARPTQGREQTTGLWERATEVFSGVKIQNTR